MSDYLDRTKNGTSFSGSDIGIYRACVIASALDLYAKTGMRANRAYTPQNMLRAASEITRVPFKRRQYAEAAQALRTWAENRKNEPRVDTHSLTIEKV
jgi:hypothetical protein